MSTTLFNSSPFPITIGTTVVTPGATITVDAITPEVAAYMSSGDMDVGTVPVYQHSLRSDDSYPVTSGSTTTKKKITAHGSITAGSGGTDGTFALGFTGGTGTAATGTFTVLDGAVTAITITTGGAYTVVPTAFDLTASTDLTGASASVTSATYSQEVFASNSNRHGWSFRNNSVDKDMYVDSAGGIASATGPTSVLVSPGQTVRSNPGFSSTSAINVYCATFAESFTASEW